MNAAHAILQAVQADLLENVMIALHKRWSGFLMDSYHDVTRNLQLAVKLIGAAGSHFDILFKCLAIEKANDKVSTYFDDQVGLVGVLQDLNCEDSFLFYILGYC
jgi:hypothetical protein